MQKRLGVSIPFESFNLDEHAEVLKRAEDLGYSDAWTAEVDGVDGFSPLVPAAVATNLRVGTAIINAYTRGPATLAMSALGMAELAPGRFELGIGAGSAPIVEGWNGGTFTRPATRVKETVQFLRQALAGERVTFQGETINVNGFRTTRPTTQPPRIHVAGLREGMLRVAGEVGDGAIINWMSAEDVPRLVKIVRDAAEKAGRDPSALEISARIFVFADPPEDDNEEFRRRLFTFYLPVPTYWKYQVWLGREGALRPMMDAWNARDRKAAVAALPQNVMDDLVIRGTPEERREHVERFHEAGVDTIFLHFQSSATDRARHREITLQAIEDHAPR